VNYHTAESTERERERERERAALPHRCDQAGNQLSRFKRLNTINEPERSARFSQSEQTAFQWH